MAWRAKTRVIERLLSPWDFEWSSSLRILSAWFTFSKIWILVCLFIWLVLRLVVVQSMALVPWRELESCNKLAWFRHLRRMKPGTHSILYLKKSLRLVEIHTFCFLYCMNNENYLRSKLLTFICWTMLTIFLSHRTVLSNMYSYSFFTSICYASLSR